MAAGVREWHPRHREARQRRGDPPTELDCFLMLQ
jgi:hypothetical protein